MDIISTDVWRKLRHGRVGDDNSAGSGYRVVSMREAQEQTSIYIRRVTTVIYWLIQRNLC